MDIKINKSKILETLFFLYKNETEEAFKILLSMLDTQEQESADLTNSFPKNITGGESLTISYCRLCGYNWIAKDSDGKSYAFKQKPRLSTKYEEQKVWISSAEGVDWIPIDYPLSFVSSEASEPFYIGN